MKYKGSITIEAALVIPIVFYSILLVYSLMSYLHMDYQISRAAVDSAIDFSYDSYLLYHFEVSDILAHHSVQRQDLKPEDFIKIKQQMETTISQDVDAKSVLDGELQNNFKELLNMSKGLMGKISNMPKDISGITKSEATTFASRFVLDNYLKLKINRRMKAIAGYQPSKLNIKLANYLFDFKASQYYVSYNFVFPLQLPFLKEAEIVQPIYIESFIGNIIRYDGSKYKNKKEEEKKEEEIVYIVPKGNRYHTNRSCHTIDRTVEKIAFSQIKNSQECKICKKANLTFGQYVYKKSGKTVYHATEECSSIVRDVQEITLKEAEEKGLTKCKICGK